MVLLVVERASQILRVSLQALARVPPKLVVALFHRLIGALLFSCLLAADFVLFVINLITPPLRRGHVVKPGRPGAEGLWPPFIPPTASDSRSPCPGLNAMANHGILPRNGRNITMDELNKALNNTFNFSKSLTLNTTSAISQTYDRNHIDLSDLSHHNLIEHDASFIREDTYFEPDQSKPSERLILDLLNSASGPRSAEHPAGYLTPADLSHYASIRRAQSKRDNPVYSLSFMHAFFAASNASLLYEAFGGDVETLRTVLLQERFPEKFETSMRQRVGFTMFDFHLRSAEIALGIRDDVVLPSKKQ